SRASAGARGGVTERSEGNPPSGLTPMRAPTPIATETAGAACRAPVEAKRRRYFHRCSCGRPIPEGVMRCSSRTCPEYAPTWARDTRRRLFVNLGQLKLSVMFSVTAPGADLYPFDPRFCSHPLSVRCSGRLGCQVDPDVGESFNRRAGKWWSELHRAAKV